MQDIRGKCLATARQVGRLPLLYTPALQARTAPNSLKTSVRFLITPAASKYKRPPNGGLLYFGVPRENRTPDTAVKGRCLNLLTMGTLILIFCNFNQNRLVIILILIFFARHYCINQHTSLPNVPMKNPLSCRCSVSFSRPVGS